MLLLFLFSFVCAHYSRPIGQFDHIDKLPHHLHTTLAPASFRNRLLHPHTSALPSDLENGILGVLKSDQHTQWIVQVKGPITQTWKDSFNLHLQAADEGLTLGQYIPHNAFLVKGPRTASFAQHLQASPGFLAVTEYDHTFKVAPELNGIQSKRDEHVIWVQLSSVYGTTIPDHSQLAQSWETYLKEKIPVLSLTQVGPHVIEIKSKNSTLSELLDWLSRQPDVHWIEAKREFKLMNKFAKTIIQSDADSVPIWDASIQGDNQIVAVGDTGIDYDSCFFNDPNVAVPINRVDFSHRKIVTYVTRGDGQDDLEGHGTHVTGSLAGDVLDSTNTLSQYNGMAPKAKLAFWDFKRTNSDNLNVPSDLYNDYYLPSQQSTHAFITSNSWGSPEGGTYDITASETDRYAHDYQDFLPIFAAGNYGEDYGYFSITSPAVAKNVLAVGASKSSSESFYELGQEAGIQLTSPSSVAGSYQVIPASFGKPFYLANLPNNTQIVAASPYRACGAINNSADLRGKIALVERGDCVFTVKATGVQAAGAIALLVVQSDGSPPIVMGGTASIQIPCGSVYKSLGDSILGAAPSPVLANCPIVFESPDMNENVLASFSSRGPTADGRIKPDVVAPGQFIVSVRSDGSISSNNCNNQTDLIRMQGTSMSTPITAGAAALIRQYYVNGYYPTGSANSTNTLQPSAALVKATLIASGVSIGGQVDTISSGKAIYYNVDTPPSVFQGFGRIQLNTALKLSQQDQNLFVADRQSVSTNQLNSYCFSYEKGTTTSPYFKATLVWVDSQSTPAQNHLLINNLDLFVAELETNQVYIGNSRYQDGTQPQWDNINNVEQVSIRLTNATKALFSVHVRGTNVPMGPQLYALVVNGQFQKMDLSACAGTMLCPNNCGSAVGHGNCTDNGVCQCNLDRAGADCGELSEELVTSTDTDVYFTGGGSITPWAWKYYHFDVSVNDSYPDGLEIVLDRTTSVGDPDLYVSFEKFPSVDSYDYASTDCNSCRGSSPKSSVTIPSSQIQHGRYRIAIFGYCCDNSSYDLAVQKPTPEPGYTMPPAAIAMIVVVSVFVVAVILVYFYKRRTASNSSHFVRLQGNQLGSGGGGYPLGDYPATQAAFAPNSLQALRASDYNRRVVPGSVIGGGPAPTPADTVAPLTSDPPRVDATKEDSRTPLVTSEA